MKDNLQKTLLFVLIQIFITLLIVLYFILKRTYAPNYIFWILISLNIIYVSSIIIFYRKHYIVFLIIFVLSIGLIPITYLNEVRYLEKDAIFESQFADSLIKNDRYDPRLGKGFAENYYGYNPLLHVILAKLSIISGLNTYIISKTLLPLIFRVLILILTYIIAFELTRDKFIAAISSLIAFVSPAFIPISVSRRTLGEVFLLLSLLYLIKYTKKNKLSYYVLYLISSVLIIVSDHSTSYILLLFLVSAYVYTLISNMFVKDHKFVIFNNLSVHIIIFFVLFLTWETIFARVLFNTELGYIGDIILFIKTSFGIDSVLGSNVYGPSAVHINLIYETILAYASQLIFIAIASLGIIYFLINFKRLVKDPNQKILTFLVIFGFIGYIISGLLIRTRLNVVSSTVLWIFTIPLAILISLTIFKVVKFGENLTKFSAVIVISLIFISGLIIGFTPSITNRDFNKDIVLGEPRSRSLELFDSGKWLKSQVNDAKVLGDPTVFDIYTGFYSFDTATDFETFRLYKSSPIELESILGNGILFGNYKHTQFRSRVDYLIINEAVFKYPSFIFNEPLDEDIIIKFDKSESLDRIYDNQEIFIYKNNFNN